MNILVTGGAGFIGSNFIYYQLAHNPNDKIICLDKLTYAGNLITLENAMNNSNFSFIKGDICDYKTVDDVMEKYNIDVIVNFAAESHVDRSIKNPDLFLKTNIMGTQVLLNAANRYNIKRFHQVSTDEVYGDLPLGRPDLLFTETTPIHTSSPYSASKASADLLAHAYYRTYGTPVSISRCSNNYGPFHFPEKLIPLMIMKALSNKKLPVYGTGENVRDWLHVFDHCSAIDLIIRKGKVGEVYNVGGNNEMSNIEVVKTILKALDKPLSLIEFIEDRKGHDLRYAIDSSKISSELGWKPTKEFTSGILETIKWNLDNQSWIKKIITGEYLEYYKNIYKEFY